MDPGRLSGERMPKFISSAYTENESVSSDESPGSKPVKPKRPNLPTTSVAPAESQIQRTVISEPSEKPQKPAKPRPPSAMLLQASPMTSSPDLPPPETPSIPSSSYVVQLAEMKRRMSEKQPTASPPSSYNSQATTSSAYSGGSELASSAVPRMSARAAAFLQRTSNPLANSAVADITSSTTILSTMTTSIKPLDQHAHPLPSPVRNDSSARFPSFVPCYSSDDILPQPSYLDTTLSNLHHTTNINTTSARSAAFLQRTSSLSSSSDSHYSAAAEVRGTLPPASPSVHGFGIPRPPPVGRTASYESVGTDATDATGLSKRSSRKNSLVAFITSFSRRSSNKSDRDNKLNHTVSLSSWGDRSVDNFSEIADGDDGCKIGGFNTSDPVDGCISLLHSHRLSEEQAGRAFNDLLIAYFDSDANKEKMRSNKTLSLVVRIVKQFIHSHSVVEQGCLLLGLFVKYNTSMAELRAYQLVLTAMLKAHAAADPDSSFDAVEEMAGISIPSSLIHDSEHSNEVEVADVIERVLAAHMTHEDVLIQACMVVGYLAHKNDTMCGVLSNLGVCEHLTLMLITFEENTEIIEYVLSAIADIASTSEDKIKMKLGRLNANKLILKLLRKYALNARVVEQGCYAIAHIANGIDEGIRDEFGASGTCELVLELMKSNSMNADIAEATCDALSSLCLSASNRELLEDLNAEETIKSISKKLRLQKKMVDDSYQDV